MSANQQEKNMVCTDCLGQPKELSDLVQYVSGSIVSKGIMDRKVGTITLFAFDKGQGLSEHRSPFDAVVQVIDGEAELTIGGEAVKVTGGQIIIMPAGIAHSVKAAEKFKMLLTMIRK